jgi:mono/diheme cytochrome c family protein
MKTFTILLAGVSLAALLSACRGDRSEDPPILLERNMYHQERFDPESYTDFFPDHRTMRTPEMGTISREEYDAYGGDESVRTGMTDPTTFVMTIPQSVVAARGGYDKLEARGQERFNIYCAPCHSRMGDGKGAVARVANGFAKVSDLHDKAIREMPDGEIFATITNGVRTMPSYAAQIPLQDRWAIVSYVRALELNELSQAEPKK